jgi:hypothetical protein
VCRGDYGELIGTESADSASARGLATFDQYRGLLFSVAYRLLGSVADGWILWGRFVLALPE